jgi:hypothetical protein
VIGAAGEKVNSVLVPVPRAMALIVRAAVPEFTICVVSVAEPPTVTVLKFRLVGFSVIAGDVVGPVTVNWLVATLCSPCPEFEEGNHPVFPEFVPNDAPATSYWFPYQATIQV